MFQESRSGLGHMTGYLLEPGLTVGFPDNPDDVVKLETCLHPGASLLGNQARDALCGPRNLHVIILDSSTHGEIEKLERLRLRSIREGTTLRYSSDGEQDGEGGGELAGNVRLGWDV